MNERQLGVPPRGRPGTPPARGGVGGADPTLLIVAKVPVPGLAKTRIASTVGDSPAAELAAAALLDTLQTATAVGWPVVVALTGDLDDAACGSEIAEALSVVRVVDQRGNSLGERLAQAHLDADVGRGVVQVGMDSPQVTVDDYLAAGDAVCSGRPALGPAADGGWWLLGLPNSAEARCLEGVRMSQGDTCAQTEHALGGDVVRLRLLRDMDTWDDALAIARDIPASRLAHTVRKVEVAA